MIKLKTRLRLIPTAIVLTAALGAAACQNDNVTSPPPTPPSGAYVLKTINGQGLPFAVPQSDGTSSGVTVIASYILLNTDSTFAEVTTSRTDVNGSHSQSTATAGGTYSVSGTGITLTATDSTVTVGSVSANSLAFTSGGFDFNYTR